MIWLDSAATTFQKPPEVARAMENALAEISTPGRGSYPAAMRAAETALACREELADMFHAGAPERVVFTMNATHGLNIAIKSLIPPGGKAVISAYEHNAVTRPLAALNARVEIADAPLFQESAMIRAFDRLITPDTDAVICTHVSNVFGFILPLDAIAEICRQRRVPLIVDASQSAGAIPLDMDRLGAAFIAMPGHKGLYGPQGTGVLLCADGVQPRPLMEGGTGSNSIRQEMPDFLPDRLESGTPNMPGIAGLLAGVRYIRRRGPESVCGKERRLAILAADELRKLPGTRVFALSGLRDQAAVVSFLAEKMDAESLGDALGRREIAVRAGLHCAPLAHKTAGTLKSGTVRVSFSDFNTQEEVLRFLSALRDILR